MANGIGLLDAFDNHTDEPGTSWLSPAYHQNLVGEQASAEQRKDVEKRRGPREQEDEVRGET